MSYCKHILLALAILMTFTTLGVADDVFKVNTSIKPPFSNKTETGFFDLIIKELGRRATIQAELVRLPPERALVSANEGISDMELPRIAGIGKKYPNLIMVPEKIIDYKFVAFTRKKESIETWQDLHDRRVGYLIGWKIFENNVPAIVSPAKLKKPAHMFTMLEHGRLDVALYESYAGWQIARSHGLKILEAEPPLAVKPMYMYVHKSNEYLVPILDKHLKEMKADGTYEKIADQTLNTR